MPLRITQIARNPRRRLEYIKSVWGKAREEIKGLRKIRVSNRINIML